VAKQPIIIDGKEDSGTWQSIIDRWVRESIFERDRVANAILGLSTSLASSSSNQGVAGMQAIVRRAHLFYTCRHWEIPNNNLPIKDQDHFVYPWFFGVLQQILGMVSPQNIRIGVQPLGTDTDQFAAYANTILEEECEELKFEQLCARLVERVKLLGTQAVYFGYDAYKGPLNVKRYAEFCDPMAFFWEPRARSFDDSKYIVYKRQVPIDYVYRHYNLDPDQIKIEPRDLEQLYTSDMPIYDLSTRGSSTNRCVETICYLRDSTLKTTTLREIIPTLPEDQQQEVMQTATDTQLDAPIPVEMYPNGRVIALVNDNLIDDRPNPFHHKKWPFLIMNNYEIPGMLWGLPEWIPDGDMQLIINEAVSGQVRSARQGFKKLAIEEGNVINPKALKNNDPRQVIKLNAGSIAKGWHEVIDMGGDNGRYEQSALTAINIGDRVSGVNDTTRGIPNSDVTSGVQAQIYTSNANSRNAPFMQNFEQFVTDSGYLMLWNAAQFRNPQDILYITSNLKFKGQQFSMDNFDINVKFKTRMLVKSGMPTDRQSRMKLFTELMPAIQQAMLVGPEFARAIVDGYDIPELTEAFDASMERMQQQAQEQQQLAAQAQGQLQPPNGQPMQPGA
jgi:hypothetical protein